MPWFTSTFVIPQKISSLFRLGSSALQSVEPKAKSEDFFTHEENELKKLESALLENRPESGEEQLQQLALVEHLAQQYVQQAGEDGKEDDSLRLAEESYELLGKIAASSSDEEVNHRARYYDALRFLLGGDEDGARSILTDEVNDLPEAKAVLETMDKVEKTEQDHQARGRHRMLALGVLDIWSAYADEGEAYEQDQAKGVLGVALGTIRYYTESGHKTMPDHVAAKWNLDRDLIHEIKQKIQSDEAETVDEALSQIEDESERFRPRIQQLKMEEGTKENSGAYILAHLIGYVSHDPGDPKLLQYLLKDVDNLSSRMNAVQTPYAIYSLLKATETDSKVKAECSKQLEAIEKGKNLPDIVWDMIRTTGTDDLAQLAMMAGASKVGSIARLAALGRLEKAGITGYKALALAYGTEVLAEGTALWAMNTVYESMLHDTEKVFEGKKLLKSWGANIVMITGLKGAGGLAGKYAPHVAKFLNFVEDEKLTQTGMATVWGLHHFAGLTGMVGTTQLNQSLGLNEAPKGGFKESLAHDLFSYIKYGAAQKGVDHVLGPDYVAAREERHEQIRQKEEKLLRVEKNSSEKASILESPLLAPLWMLLGVDGIGSGRKIRPAPTEDALRLQKLNETFLKHFDEQSDPATLREDLSVIADLWQASGEPRGKWVALELKRQELRANKADPKAIKTIANQISKTRRKIEEEIKTRFGLVVKYQFDPTKGFQLQLDGEENPSVTSESLGRFLQSSYASLLTGLHISKFGPGQEWVLPESNLRHLTALRELYIRWCDENELVRKNLPSLLHSPTLSKLRSLDLWANDLQAEDVRAIGVSPILGNLQSLDLSVNDIGDKGARFIAVSKALANLQSLNLRDNSIGDKGLRAIAASESLGKLLFLDIAENEYDAKGIRAIANSKTLGNLQSLSIDMGEDEPDKSVRAIVQSKIFSKLQSLDLEGWGLYEEEADSIQNSPGLPKLVHFKYLSLGHDDPSEDPDAG